MKKVVCTGLIWLLVCVLAACGASFNGSRTGSDSEFVMEYSIFNTSDAQDLKAVAGDTIHAELVVEGGSLTVQIQKDGDDPVYEGEGIANSYEFDVEITESGTYTVRVTGEHAKGSVRFTVEP